jgi:hypothetical protein
VISCIPLEIAVLKKEQCLLNGGVITHNKSMPGVNNRIPGTVYLSLANHFYGYISRYVNTSN